jgi:hypothetical protein
MKKTLFICALTLICFCASAQNVGINATAAAPDASAMLDVSATNKGLLIPRASLTSTVDVTTIPSPATSLLVYNTNASMTGGAIGYYYYSGSSWVAIGGGKELIWHSSMNSANTTNQYAGAQTAYLNSPTGAYNALNEALTQVKMPKCTITRLRVVININGQNSAGTITLRKNGVSQALAVTLPATTTGTFEATGAISFVDGDLLSIQAVLGGTAGQGIGILRVELSYY